MDAKVNDRLIAAEREFDEVAHLIAPGVPGISRALLNVSGVVGRPHDQDGILNLRLADMQKAAACLIRWMPGVLSGTEVEITLRVLRRLERTIAKALTPHGRKGGPDPNVSWRICAQVIVELWCVAHPGQRPVAGIALKQACQDYWHLCTGEERDADKWRDYIRDAIAADREWVRLFIPR
jgi:hypothetical protein